MKVCFYTEPTWAFGAIHYGLIKHLKQKGITANVLSYFGKYSDREWDLINKTYDVFVTTPCYSPTHLTYRGISPDRIILIAHGRPDYYYGLKCEHKWETFRGMAAISPMLIKHAHDIGITTPIKLLQNGIEFDFFYQPHSTRLESIGYAGIWSRKDETDGGKDWKRPNIAVKIADNTHTKFVHNSQKLYYQAMPAFYSEMDCLINTSTYKETCGLPIMEAAAAGRLVMSANIGIVDHLNESPGIIVSEDEEDFIQYGGNLINYYKTYPSAFESKTKTAQEFAREHYDWSVVIDDWVDVIAG